MKVSEQDFRMYFSSLYCRIFTNEDVLSSFDIFEIPFVSKKLVSLFV